MKSIRRMDYDEMLAFMNNNRLKEITNNDGIKISRNKNGGLNISVDDGKEMDLKFYISLFQGLAQS
ncbi:hypothetical protein CACET_c27170 [Clostridium aceticum]|uniref:Uncharacterized protein n=1 Tax=Clostridium aceticum TaxID=84022 RepID=A0A0D8I8J1_9CLOT|nr:hypothetical protein [Clostridium aceticum]AKL96162.1 hypothetical protein CACET_c27170 [Clostridium aceticum]KJF26583.1 hypothetical protein TZ02_11955 [Clostridium aceticum]